MTKRERIQFFLIWLFLGVLPLFFRTLWEPDEARYAEIPREMLTLGDWLTPRLNFVLYFEKPPLQYWLSALSMKAFGTNPVAARLPLALASGIAMGSAYLLARRLGARRPIWAAFMSATAILGFVCSQILILDALFTALLVASLALTVEAVTARYEERSSMGWTIGAFSSLALALLTKGLAAPVLLGGVLIGSLPFAWGDRKLRKSLLRVAGDPLGWLLFLGLSVPWFWFVDQANPGHARFFFIHEHFARFTSNVHDREASTNPVLDKLYFVGVLLVGLLPWLSASLIGLKRGWAFALRSRGPMAKGAPVHRWIVAVTLLGVGVPLVFFSFSGSKLAPYILPAVVPVMALACAMEREGEEAAALRRHGWELLFLGLVLIFLVPFLLKNPGGMPWAVLLGGAFLLHAFWAFRPKGLTADRWMAGLGAVMLLITLTATKAVERDKSNAAMIARAPRDAQWVSVGYYFQNIPFLTGRRVLVVAGTTELAFGRDRLPLAERNYWFREDLMELNAAAAELRASSSGGPVWALVDIDIWPYLTGEQKRAWEVVDRTHAVLLLRFR